VEFKFHAEPGLHLKLTLINTYSQTVQKPDFFKKSGFLAFTN